ncbi:hypothetical protein L1887_26836 [Cichorium endivia]|nr:hypothetical protein L1887_26836 [Cichorium endivia]
MFFPYTADLADELKIPRLLFYASCFKIPGLKPFQVQVSNEQVNGNDSRIREAKLWIGPQHVLRDRTSLRRSHGEDKRYENLAYWSSFSIFSIARMGAAVNR